MRNHEQVNAARDRVNTLSFQFPGLEFRTRVAPSTSGQFVRVIESRIKSLPAWMGWTVLSDETVVV